MRLPEMNHKKIQRIMRKYDLVARVRRRNPYKAIMKKRLEHRIFPNKLLRAFGQNVPLQSLLHRYHLYSIPKHLCIPLGRERYRKWRSSGVGIYLTVLKRDLVLDTMRNMPRVREDAMIHSDQGFHYTNPQYIETVEGLGMIQSMSGKGSCIDNAPIESFFGHMKDELDYRSCATFEELRSRVDEYMRYYNHERKQWTRNKMSPIEYKNHLLLNFKRGRRCVSKVSTKWGTHHGLLLAVVR